VSTAAEEAIRAEIERGGPIPFARFMALALGHPGGGYYTGRRARPTRDGDFLTAPELHPIFGAALARQLEDAWDRLGRPDPFTLVEYGAGGGTLALSILAGLREDRSSLADALVYAPIELNDHRLVELGERAAAAGLRLVLRPTGAPRFAGTGATEGAGAAEAPAVADVIAGAELASAAAVVGAVLANEFLDALPVHAVEVRDGRILEVHVGLTADGTLTELLLPPSTPSIADRLATLAAAGVTLEEGQRAELCLALDGWVAEVAAMLSAGLVLVIDYGAATPDLYGPRRQGGTLMTYRGHRADGSRDAPYRDVGERDITAHVDTTTLARLLDAAGIEVFGETTQAELLASCGLEDLIERERRRAMDAAAVLLLRSAVMRLLDPRHLGGHRAVLAGRGIPGAPPLRGLAYRSALGRQRP
jgi:SAM-dependent MidA family methyltransferase